MKRFSFLILMILTGFCSGQVFAQLAVLRDSGTGIPITTNPYREVKGSAYFQEFKQGVLELKDGRRVEGLQIALNGYEHTLEYKLEGNLFAYSPEKLKGFSFLNDMGEETKYTSEFTLPTLSKKRFLQVVEEGKYTLLLHSYKIMVDDVAATYGAQAAKAFQNQEDFFIAKDGVLYLVKNKSKDLEEVFGEDYNKAMSIQKSQKLNFKSLSDLAVLVRALNQ
ncbi:hypothetical protein [Algoriphagus mannitolivorans]|uniref:hypothetical protein n=1 Tax=Algoriphagus mannitolivorans TaxID=226504 RepID=UPI0005503272|nr:hypothetical protein [Algoriphagus mannitolivorans]